MLRRCSGAYISEISEWTSGRPLADSWETQILTDLRPFYIVHTMMALAAAGRAAAAERMFSAGQELDEYRIELIQ
jgi:hypothetical protein